LTFRFADFEIDVARQELRRAGAIVHIEPQVFDLLVHLIRNRDRIVSKDELFDSVWQGRIVSEATLSSRISAARRALGDSGNDQSFIRTLYKRGFRFVGDIDDGSSPAAPAVIEKALSQESVTDDAAELVPSGEPLPLLERPLVTVGPLQNGGPDPDRAHFSGGLIAAPAQRPAWSAPTSGTIEGNEILHDDRGPGVALLQNAAPSVERSVARNLLLTASWVGLASLLLAIGWRLLSPPALLPTAKGQMALATAADAPARPAGLVPSIIVRPFTNLSGDAKQDYVADGITDSLISDLARALPGMPVVSRDTAFTYKDRGTDARQIGRELEVRYLLEGSVVLESERVRVNVQLVETKEGNQLWADRFDTERTSILQVQDEIVSRVSRAIGLKVVDIEARRSARERPTSAEAMDLVLRGKAALNLPSSPASMIEARGLFEQALKVQPTNVDSLAGVAASLVFEFLNGYYEADGEKRLRRAELLLDRAVAVDPRHVMVLKTKAALRRAQGKFDDAIATAEAIIAENPAEPWAYKEIGLSNMYLGRPGEALDWFAKADRIGPRDPGRWTWLDGRGHALILLGRDEEAIRALIASLDANPKSVSPHAFLAAAYALLGRTDEAQASLAAYLQKRPGARVSTFRRLSPVPLARTSPQYQHQHARLKEGLRLAGMPE